MVYYQMLTGDMSCLSKYQNAVSFPKVMTNIRLYVGMGLFIFHITQLNLVPGKMIHIYISIMSSI